MTGHTSQDMDDLFPERKLASEGRGYRSSDNSNREMQKMDF